MNQSPLFRRRPSAQPPRSPAPPPTPRTCVEYLRLQGHPQNPGALLAGQTVVLAPGGVLDLVAHPHGGLGLGALGYPQPLAVGLKRQGGSFTYRFQLPWAATAGERFLVHCQGHDGLAAFSFVLETGARRP